MCFEGEGANFLEVLYVTADCRDANCTCFGETWFYFEENILQ
jgi:hypothetical protein